MWLDSHCHVTAERFDDDRSEVIERAFACGVEALLTIGSGYGAEGNGLAVALAEQDPRIFATVGVHPHESERHGETERRQIESWVRHPRVVAVGECGLDYHYMNSPRDVQRRVFAEQVSLARACDLPVSIHVRSDDESAYDDLLEIWLAEGGRTLEGVLHCYTGSQAFARRALDAGFSISFSGIVTFKKSDALREVARSVPLDRLLVETDAPFLAPEGRRGRRNEPAWVALVGTALAELHGVEPEAMARATTTNARRLFRLPPAGTEPA